MSNWGQHESRFTVIIWGMEHSEGTSPNEASVGSKAALRLAPWQRTGAGAREYGLGQGFQIVTSLSANSSVAWAVAYNNFETLNLPFGFILGYIYIVLKCQIIFWGLKWKHTSFLPILPSPLSYGSPRKPLSIPSSSIQLCTSIFLIHILILRFCYLGVSHIHFWLPTVKGKDSDPA